MAKLKRKTLKKVSKQLTKASKMHAGQSKKIAKLAESLQEGGYPKSDKKDFMKRMGYYQGGGLATPPMYGANTMPGSQETAAITYTEADPSKLKALEEQLKETQESTQYMDKAEANMAKQQATIDSIEQSLGQGLEKAEELGVFDKLKARGAQKAADKLGREALAKGTTLAGGVSDDALQALAPKLFEKSITPGIQSATSSLPSSLANFTAAPLQVGQSGATSLIPSSMGTQGANLLNTGANVGASAGKGLIGSVGPGGVGAIASLAGEGIKMASDDQDATTMNTGESIGSGLSGIGTGIGAAMTTAALMGTSLGPLGTAAGAIGGAVYGLGKGLISRGKARREMKKAEKKQERDEQNIASAQKLEALKSRMYSGYDMGADIAEYGGVRRYNDGGVGENIFQKGVQKTGEFLLKKAPGLVGRLGKFGTAVSAPVMLYDFYNRGQEMSGGKVRPNITEEEMNKANPSMGGKSIAEVNAGIPKFKGFSFEMGGVKLPGGMAKPIPGSDAIEFKGRSHEQGGIMIDPNTEVEGDETMDKVTMKNGGKNDYFFSQHLKLGGKSFAQRHKDLLKNGGTQGEIDYLAKLQEEKAGRNPNVVKLGSGWYITYQGDQPDYSNFAPADATSVGIFVDRSPLNVPNPLGLDLNLNGVPDYLENQSDFKVVPDEEKEEKKKEENKKTNTKPKEEEKREEFNFTPIQPKTITQIPVNNAPAPGTYVDLQGNTVTPQMGPEGFDYDSLSQEDKNVIDKANSNQELTDLEKKALKRLNRDVPGLAMAAGAAQLIAPAYAFFKKDRVAEQMGAPGRIKAPALDRVSFNAERAANAAQSRAINRSIDTSGAGPAGIIAKMSTYRQKQQGDIQIAAQEARMNTAIANQEAQMEQQANARNVANAMQADQINTQLRERQLAANEDRRLGAIDSFTERTAGLAGDLMSYKANERLARATGDMGIYERDRLRNFLSKEINPRTNKPYTNAEIAQLFNIRFGEAQPTKETKEKDNE